VIQEEGAKKQQLQPRERLLWVSARPSQGIHAQQPPRPAQRGGLGGECAGC